MESLVYPFSEEDSRKRSTDQTPKGNHRRLFLVIYAWSSPFDLAAQGSTPDNPLSINPAATGLANVTKFVANTGANFLKTTRLTNGLEANEGQDQ